MSGGGAKRQDRWRWASHSGTAIKTVSSSLPRRTTGKVEVLAAAVVVVEVAVLAGVVVVVVVAGRLFVAVVDRVRHLA